MNFAIPRQLDFDADEQKRIVDTVLDLYDDTVRSRSDQSEKHEHYEQMFRGDMPKRQGPWEGSADIHVQVPYWLVDTVAVRTTSAMFANVPLLSCHVETNQDEQRARNASHLVEWHMSQKRMDLRPTWHRLNKLRCIHGISAGWLSYVNDTHRIRLEGDEQPQGFVQNPDGTYQEDEDSNFIPLRPKEQIIEQEYYRGPVLTPLDFSDIVAPLGCMNLQPNRPSNPKGADWVICRGWERLSLMFKKARGGRGGVASYSYMFDDDEREEKEWWIGKQPSQDRTGRNTGDNNKTARRNDRSEGINRTQATVTQNKVNPEFEVLTFFGQWEIDGEDTEVVFFVCSKPEIFLGGFILTDYYFKGDRPLIEWHYQTVGTRFYSMGIMEIVKYLSAEVDTIHNMRLDVGFATNMPFFLYQSASGFDPDDIELRPMKGIPVDDVNAVRFQQMQGQTTFYYQEEQLLFTLIERVLGVSDLFLGANPTRGAAARHATGFVGAQQEAEARMAEVINQDVRTFSKLADMIYNMELQYGPPERQIRLEGEGRVPIEMQISKDDLLIQGEYDFTLGPNYGTYSQSIKQQQAQAVQQLKGSSPLLSQDPARMWEADYFYLTSVGVHNPERFIGTKDALPQQQQRSQEQENGMMDEYYWGVNVPAPVHPNDDDDEHMRIEMEYIQSDIYRAQRMPNMEAHMKHMEFHMRQKQQKMMAMQQQQQGMQPQNGQANPMARAESQMSPMMGAQPQNVATNENVQMPEIPAPPQ